MGLISGLEENSQHGSRLMSLPDELILSVIEQIDDSKSLRNFILTCQKAQNRAEPYLYRNLVFRNGEDVVRFLNALKYMPKRGDYAQLLDVRYKVAHRHGIRLLDGKLGRLANLRSWRIESPCPNDNMAFSFTGEFGTGEGVLHYWDDLPKLKHLHSSMYPCFKMIIKSY